MNPAPPTTSGMLPRVNASALQTSPLRTPLTGAFAKPPHSGTPTLMLAKPAPPTASTMKLLAHVSAHQDLLMSTLLTTVFLAMPLLFGTPQL